MKRILAIVLLAGAFTGAEEPEEAWLLLAGRGGAAWVRADGKEVFKAPTPPQTLLSDSALSPGGRAWLVARNDGDDGGVFLQPAAGGEMRRLLEGTEGAQWPAWQPDGESFVYGAPAEGVWQVFRARIGEGPVEGEQITREAHGIVAMELRPDGKRLALAARPGAADRSKIELADVVVLDPATGERKVVLREVRVLELAWSPDGSLLAVSTTQALEIHAPARGKLLRRTPPQQIDERLRTHAAWDLCWRPDGKEIACRISFLGARHEDETGAIERLLGDREVFFVPVEGAVRWIEVPEELFRGPFRWGRP